MLSKGLILASASPRRRQLFSLLGVPFTSLTAGVEENRGHDEKPEEMVCRLSRTKAEALAEEHPEKPIVAADVPCHRELLQDGVNARLYRYDDPEHLAACIQSLVELPREALEIVRTAWQQAAEYSYDGRAQRILELVGEVRANR